MNRLALSLALCALNVWLVASSVPIHFSCHEAQLGGEVSGETRIRRNGADTLVFCDQENESGGWELILNNLNNDNLLENFLFEEYAAGVGSPVHDGTKNYFTGLRDLHLLTQPTASFPDGFEAMVRVTFTNAASTWRYTVFPRFSVGPEADKFRLAVALEDLTGNIPYNKWRGGGFSTAGGQRFSAKDQDNDNYIVSGGSEGDCVALYPGNPGWWFNDCHRGVLTDNVGGNTFYWNNDQSSLTINKAQLLIRPVSYVAATSSAEANIQLFLDLSANSVVAPSKVSCWVPVYWEPTTQQGGSTFNASLAWSWEATPALPTGITIDARTGVISGYALAASLRSSNVYTATGTLSIAQSVLDSVLGNGTATAPLTVSKAVFWDSLPDDFCQNGGSAIQPIAASEAALTAFCSTRQY